MCYLCPRFRCNLSPRSVPLRPLPQSAGEGWDGVPCTAQEVTQLSTLRRLSGPFSLCGDLCTTAYSVMGKALRPLPQSAGEGWDGVPCTTQEVTQLSTLRRLSGPFSLCGDLCTTAYSVMGKALRPLPQSAGEGWDGVPCTAQEVTQVSTLRRLSGPFSPCGLIGVGKV